MSEKCYSSNEEAFYPSLQNEISKKIERALDALSDDEETPASLEVEIWEADIEPFTVGRLFQHAAYAIIDQVGERAYELVDSHADGWHARLTDKKDELQAALESTLQAFLAAHDLMPDFWTIKNPIKKTYSVKLDAEGEVESYEEVTK